VLFAAGTDAEWYEEELRAQGLPTHRATGRGYFGQQQVADLLAYLRLLHNRYDDEALVSVLASPLVGVSNDALVLIRRAAPKRPLFTALERSVPPTLSPRDAQLCRAFLQRYERLAARAPRLSLELLCERVMAEHDYDLAVLAQWDGRRRYANLRKLARLARAYEELRGPDVEGFVRFVSDQESVGARELEAVAEEEGADAVRLLTIHAAKGLEFKTVVVADAGRDRAAPSPDEILARPDGRFGFRVADPATGKRRGAFAYDEVREAEQADEEAERRRLYYVAMTRAIDRLIVTGSVDASRPPDPRTPIGWVLDRLGVGDLAGLAGNDPVELERDGARFVLRVDRRDARSEVAAGGPRAGEEAADEAAAQLALFTDDWERSLRPAPALPPLAPVPVPPLHEVSTLSYSALALFERCSYRYFAERVAGMRPRDGGEPAGEAEDAGGLAATEIGDAVHVLLEELDLRDPRPPPPEQLAVAVRARYPRATDDEVGRVAAFVANWCESPLAQRLASLDRVLVEQPFAFEHDGVLLRGRIDLLHRDGGRALVVDYKTNALGDAAPDQVVAAEYRLQRLVYALACLRAGAGEVEVAYAFVERPDAVVSATFVPADVPALEAELSEAIGRIRHGEFRATPGELVCSGCPALDVVCAGPRLLHGEPEWH
jgi:ATP-dependent exoDNAse (exonuclease V) beta subunit